MYQSRDGASVFDIWIDAVEASGSRSDPEASIVFPDKDVLFTADFKKSGADLVLVRQETSAVILDYFRGDRRLNITTPEGAILTGETVEALASSDLQGQYAQLSNTAAVRAPIGRVEKVSGTATVLRNGVSIDLQVGDMVTKGDVVQTGASSSLSIKFNDGTVFSLSASARMVLNDMVYAADSSSNSALFTLVQGLIGFVAGRIAKTGDLKVDTPVATMAIRGTAVQAEVAAFSGATRFSLLTEPDGTVGSFLLLDKSNPSRVIASMSDARTSTLLTPIAGSEPRITQITKSGDDIRGESDFVRDLFQVFSPEPRQRRGSSDFEDAPIIPVNLPQPVDLPDSSQFAIVIPGGPGSALSHNALPGLTPVLAPVRGRAIEDGPLTQLDALPDSVTPGEATPPPVIVPATLPPGVRYLESSRTFSLNPSHPAYQHLGEGESETVTINYALLSDDGIRIPASISWTITGRNDAPVAAGDRIGDVEESGRRTLTVRVNDRDVDGDSVNIIHWTAPLEGSIVRNSSGELIFDPGNEFKALSAGETATVTFAYTISDTKGATDTANVTLQVRGTGTFSSPHKSALSTGILEFNDQPVSLAISAPSATTTAAANLDLIIGLGPVLQPQMNILYLVDISGSTSAAFEGVPVGDLNGDGRTNTILDAEIASLIALTERIRGLGFSPADVTVTVIPFNGSADPAEETDGGIVNAATFSLGAAGEETIANHLRGLIADGETNFADALRAANERLQGLDQGGEKNFLSFLSDGNGQGLIDAELATLNDVHGAKITALGVGGNASLSQLNDIDNTGGASLLTSPDQIDVSILEAPLPSGMVADLDVFINGMEIPEIGPEDLVWASNGLFLDASVGGLRRLVGDGNSVLASVTFASGEVLTTELTIAGALPRSTDFIL
ncbi:Ig-like domain-containing protein [Microvirga sp. VF16]|uniref:Ig-like domain-containing protein n=1 Tax=Microvirga sp. VF16 TaxID=2807101 RepID=UPI00193E0BAF|nr:Ig-like domain-containing protein [Microvirga sp. VF16]QRM30308.1 cadherin-like domain-containing protein [Microvirga sp. VF16]